MLPDPLATNRLAAELFKFMAVWRYLSYSVQGSGSALTALISGEVQLSFPSVSSASAVYQVGRLKALAVTSAQPIGVGSGLGY